jgi:molecular chaperone GrpE
MSEETKKTAEAPEQEAKETEAAPQEAPETAAAPEKEAEAEPADAKKKDGWFNKKAREIDAVIPNSGTVEDAVTAAMEALDEIFSH